MLTHCNKLNFYFNVMPGGVGVDPSHLKMLWNLTGPPLWKIFKYATGYSHTGVRNKIIYNFHTFYVFNIYI